MAETERAQLQAKLQDPEEQIRLLMAPKEELAPQDAPTPVKLPWWRRILGRGAQGTP